MPDGQDNHYARSTMGEYRIEDGQLAENWFVEDDADTLQQLSLWQKLTGDTD